MTENYLGQQHEFNIDIKTIQQVNFTWNLNLKIKDVTYVINIDEYKSIKIVGEFCF